MLKFFKSRSKVRVKVTCSNFIILAEILVIRNAYAKYEIPISHSMEIMGNCKVFQKKVKVHSQGHVFKGLVISNIDAKYESHISYYEIVIIHNVEVC